MCGRDWSSDVCSSDLSHPPLPLTLASLSPSLSLSMQTSLYAGVYPHVRQLSVICVSFHSALDLLIDKLGGPTQVAEMTGRRGRIVRHDGTSKPKYELRQTGHVSDQSLNVSEVSLTPSTDKHLPTIVTPPSFMLPLVLA